MGIKKLESKYIVNIIPVGTKSIEEVMWENRDWFEKVIMRHFKELEQKKYANVDNKKVNDEWQS